MSPMADRHERAGEHPPNTNSGDDRMVFGAQFTNPARARHATALQDAPTRVALDEQVHVTPSDTAPDGVAVSPQGSSVLDQILDALKDLGTRMQTMEGKVESMASSQDVQMFDERPTPPRAPDASFFREEVSRARRLRLESLEAEPGPHHFQRDQDAARRMEREHAPNQWMTPARRVPSARDMKLSVHPFDGKEIYPGLGAGFMHWGKRFVRAISLAEASCGYAWTEDVKTDRLGHHLAGIAERYFNREVDKWWSENPTLWYVLDRMNDVFSTTVSTAQAMKYLTARKDPKRSWKEHYLFLLAVAETAGVAEVLVVENIVQYAAPEMKTILLAKYDPRRADHLRQAQELVQFAQHYSSSEPRERGRGSAFNVNEKKCYNCNEMGHIARDCPKEDRRKKSQGKKGTHFVLSLTEEDSATRNLWILDSGSSRHLTNDPDILEEAEECASECTLPDGQALVVTHRGSVQISTKVDGKIQKVKITNVFYAPHLSRNILSYGELVRKGCIIVHEDNKCKLVRRADGAPIFCVELLDNILVVRAASEANTREVDENGMKHVVFNAVSEAVNETTYDAQEATLFEFHRRLGHLAYDTIERMANDPASGIKITDSKRPNCLTCAEGKQVRNKQPRKDSGQNAPTDRIGGVICSDLKGPMTPRDRRGNRYMINFVDHKSNYCGVFLAKTKDQAARKFEHFLVYFEKRFDCKVHVLRTDGGGEYVNIDDFCARTGVSRQVSEPRNQASNGKAERMHRTILNIARCMLFGCGLPLTYWGDAVEYAAYILNRSPTRANEGRRSPMEILTNQTPDLRDIVIFGSPCTVRITDQGKALDKRAHRGYVLGKSLETKGYKVLLAKVKKVITTQHIQNIETLSEEQNRQLRQSLEEDEERESNEQRSTEEQPRQRPKTRSQGKEESPGSEGESRDEQKESKSKKRRDRRRKERTPKKGSTGRSQSSSENPVNTIVERDPLSYREAMKSVNVDKWVVAMTKEIEALEANATWVIDKKGEKDRPLHSKWVFKTKTDENGKIDKFKARLVVCGNEQVFGRDYKYTFSAVMDSTTARIILGMSVVWKVKARHWDVPNAYVKAEKEEEFDIAMRVPQGMVIPAAKLREVSAHRQEECVLRLKKSLYGLKQAGRLWNQLLHSKLSDAGYRQSQVDGCLYYKCDDRGTIMLGVYVDDLLGAATSGKLLDDVDTALSTLDVKCLGTARKFLGMRVEHEGDSCLSLDQGPLIDEVLFEFGLQDAHSVRTPIGPEECEDGELLPPGAAAGHRAGDPTIKRFQSLVGSLLWIARSTRPDIAFAVHRASRKTHAPSMSDWKAAKRVVKYLQGSKHYKLRMERQEHEQDKVVILGYSDADYAADTKDRKSVSGGLVYLDGMPVQWTCKKQTAVALSTAEAEFTSASVTCKEILGIRELFKEVGIKFQEPIELKVDNQAAIKQIESEESTGKNKHIDIKLKFIKDYARAKVVVPVYEATETMTADVLTKALSAPRMLMLCRQLGMVPKEREGSGPKL